MQTSVVSEDLLERWCLLGDHRATRAAGRDLLARWAEPHRRYHDLAHLRAVLDRVDELAAHADDPDAVRLAAFFHDAVYEPLSPDNEERSALLAEQFLGVLGLHPARVRHVAALVRVTATHQPTAADRDAAVLCDADLAILASSPADYAAYAAAVRQEYAAVPDEVFNPRRAEILNGLLNRAALFLTATARREWEDLARRNVTAELTLLRAGG